MGKQFKHYFGLITILKPYYLIRVYKMKNKIPIYIGIYYFQLFHFFQR